MWLYVPILRVKAGDGMKDKNEDNEQDHADSIMESQKQKFTMEDQEDDMMDRLNQLVLPAQLGSVVSSPRTQLV